MSYFPQAHAFTARWEGGLTDDPADRGGITKFGVSLAFLKGIAEDGQASCDTLDRMGIRLPITREVIKSLTREQAASLFKWQFWDRLHCDDLPPRLALLLYDAAVNHGPSRAVKLAQQGYNASLGRGASVQQYLAVDGVLGPLTRAALHKADTPAVHEAIIAAREGFYRAIVQSNPSQARFLKGWLNRAADLRAQVRGM